MRGSYVRIGISRIDGEGAMDPRAALINSTILRQYHQFFCSERVHSISVHYYAAL